jgi:hypothetical protein
MRTRTGLLALATALVAQTAGAQSLTTYGAVEAAGLGEGSAILGIAVAKPGLGWGPWAGVNVQTFRFINGLDANGYTYKQKLALEPSIGMQYRTESSSILGRVGYNFTGSDDQTFGLGAGGGASPVLGAQANYWGGAFEHSGIAALSTKSQYLWARGRLAVRPMVMPLYVGGELVAQGSSKNNIGYRYQVGPTLNYHITPQLHFGGSAGLRWGSKANSVKTGYVGLNFVALTDF